MIDSSSRTLERLQQKKMDEEADDDQASNSFVSSESSSFVLLEAELLRLGEILMMDINALI